MLFWDFETIRFSAGNLAPEPVCVAVKDGESKLLIAHCEPEFDDVLEHCLLAEQANSNIAFDMSVVLAWRPKLAHLVWKAYRERRVHDLLLREKMLTLADTGDLSWRTTSNGAKEALTWSQASIEKRILGIDRSGDKEDDDAWRSNYSVLYGKPASEYPPEASKYPLDDVCNGELIWNSQVERAASVGDGFDVFQAAHISVRAALALQLNSCWGISVDQAEVERMLVEFGDKYAEHHYPDLLASGAVRMAVPRRPYAKQETRAIELLGGTKPLDWEPHVERLQALGIKFKQPEPSGYVMEPLRALFTSVAEKAGITIGRTDSGEVSTDKEAQETLYGLDPALDQYVDRNELKKMVTADLPSLRHQRVHPKYDVLKKTGRTSSFGNRKDEKDPPYPAVNIQQRDKRTRHVFVASPGHVLCSVDYNYIELVSAAQQCLNVLGRSTLAERINAGLDPHAFLGAVLARSLDQSFKSSADDEENYHAFLGLKKTDPKVFKHWRTMAKPTGLGFPGGLGATTFISYAKSTFGVDLVKQEGSLDAAIALAKLLKQQWKNAFPEFEAYFQWVTANLNDLQWSSPDEERYAYISPNGMVRRNCFFTEATNGFALQTPTAEGAKISLWDLVQATHDASLDSILFGCHMVAFVHDEVIVELPEDNLTHERAFEIARIMREGMSQVMTRVKVGAEPALMRRWSKAADPVFDTAGRLKVWEPAA